MRLSRVGVALFAASFLLAPTQAQAQQVQVDVQGQMQPQPPVYQPLPPPPPPYAQAGNGQYVVPVQQPVQPTYVPQSIAMSGPRVLRDWHEGDPIPPGYHPATRVKTGAIVGGITMFAVPYFISVLVAAGNADSGSDNALYVPVLGPFIQMGNEKVKVASCTANVCTQGYEPSSVALADVTLVVDGLLQAAGAALFVYGVAVPNTVLVRNDLGLVKNLHLAPMVGKSTTGLSLAAQF